MALPYNQFNSIYGELRSPTIFFSLSAADYHWIDLQRFMPWPASTNLESLTVMEKKSMIVQNPHIATWFFSKKLNLIIKYLTPILRIKHWWARIESQNRGSDHSHGVLWLADAPDLAKLSNHVKLGYIAKKKIEIMHGETKYLEFSKHKEKSWFKDKRYLFTENELDCSTKIISNAKQEFVTKLEKDIKQQLNANKLQRFVFKIGVLFTYLNLCRWYIGVRAQPTEPNRNILSGKAECPRGLIKTHIIHVINNLSTLHAWNLEYSLIEFMFQKYSSKTFNKCLKFGLGPIPKQLLDEQLYTVTLIRGTINHAAYKAYEDELPDSLKDLVSVIQKGEDSKSVIINYVDRLVCTWTPRSMDSNEYEFDISAPHPCSLNAVTEMKNNYNDYHTDLVNSVQRHSHSKKCMRRDKITKEMKCRFGFPYTHCTASNVVVIPYSKNKENGDIYYKVDVLTRRNDAWLNQFSTLVLNNWQVS